MNILTGNVTIKRIWQLLKKTVTSADLANYSVAIDSPSDTDTKRIPLDELRVALMNSGLLDYRGDYDASVNLYPSSGGSGTGGLILKSNIWIVSVGGTIDGNVVIPGQTLMAKVDNPGQTSANWDISLNGSGTFKVYQTLTSSTSVTMDIDEGLNAKITLGHNVTITLANLVNGSEGNIIVTQGASDYTLTISPTPKVVNNGSGAIEIASGAGTITVLSYTYDGTNLYINYSSNYS